MSNLPSGVEATPGCLWYLNRKYKEMKEQAKAEMGFHGREDISLTLP
jgi:hypothetical protein